MIKGTVFPTFEVVHEELDCLVEAHPSVLRDEVLGRSDDGRPVRAVHATDPGVADDDKQVALVICGRHGNELGTRVVGPAILEWLVSDSGVETRRRQHVVVVATANPDGSVRNEFHAPPRHLSATEQRTIIALADRLLPDAIIDVHSFGLPDADLQAIVAGNNTTAGEDEMFYHAVARRMIEGASAAGFPFVLHTEKRNEAYNNFIAGYCYDRYHTLAIGMEVNHHALSPQEAGASGTAAICALLEQGNQRWMHQVDRGYPTEILKGDLATSIRPAGCSAGERRLSRVTLWPNRKFFWIGRRETPDRHTVCVPFGYSGYAADAAGRNFSLCCRVRGFPETIQANINGESVEIVTFHDACSTFVSVQVHPARKTDYEAVFKF